MYSGSSLQMFRNNLSVRSVRCVISQKRADLIYLAVEALNHAKDLFVEQLPTKNLVQDIQSIETR